ncbi:unnamed protein product, partial [Brassica oleracea]
MDDMRPPPRPPGFQHLPKKTRKRLKREGLSIIQPADLRQLMDDRDIRETKGTGREGPFKLSDDGIVLMLCWDGKEPVFTQLLQIADWEELCGPVRDQLKHIICWAYSSTDLMHPSPGCSLLSSCTWYLSSNVHPYMLGKDESAQPRHTCYGCTTIDALEHIKRDGVPRELSGYRQFSCRKVPPSVRNPNIHIDSYRIFDTLQEALAHLPKQPIGATLIEFSDLWKLGEEDIYEGPLTAGSVFLGYHGVVIIRIMRFRGKLVAICKSSNGTRVGTKGYFRVSLSALYMVLCCGDEKAEFVRATPSPQPLLSCFICPIYNEPEPQPIRKRKWLPWKKYHESRKRRQCLSHGDDQVASSSGDVLKSKHKKENKQRRSR